MVFIQNLLPLHFYVDSTNSCSTIFFCITYLLHNLPLSHMNNSLGSYVNYRSHFSFDEPCCGWENRLQYLRLVGNCGWWRGQKKKKNEITEKKKYLSWKLGLDAKVESPQQWVERLNNINYFRKLENCKQIERYTTITKLFKCNLQEEVVEQWRYPMIPFFCPPSSFVLLYLPLVPSTFFASVNFSVFFF